MSVAERIFHQDFFVLLVLSAVLLGLGLFFTKAKSWLSSALLVIGSAYAYILLWLSLHSGIDEQDLATMACLVIYTIIGLATYIHGLRMYGGVLLGLVVARLLFVDVWDMELTGRIITFFLVGALLISTAFIPKQKPPSS